jgi:Protein of unknown function (DUF3563)
MRVSTPTAADPGFIALCIQLAQATLSDVMPSTAGDDAAARSSRTNGANSAQRPSWTDRLNDWFYRQQLNQREAYLAQATDIFDLELRMRRLERRPYY